MFRDELTLSVLLNFQESKVIDAWHAVTAEQYVSREKSPLKNMSR